MTGGNPTATVADGFSIASRKYDSSRTRLHTRLLNRAAEETVEPRADAGRVGPMATGTAALLKQCHSDSQCLRFATGHCGSRSGARDKALLANDCVTPRAALSSTSQRVARVCGCRDEDRNSASKEQESDDDDALSPRNGCGVVHRG